MSFGQLKVTFKTAKIPPSKEANPHLFLVGDFNGWNPADKAFEMQSDGTGSYQLTKTMRPGKYDFKITRGTWLSVECGVQGHMIGNREIAVSHDTTVAINIANWQDNFKQEDKKHTASAHVHIVSESFDLPQLGRQRRVWIYLPAGYETSGRKYPVIYMHDGQNLFDDYTSGYGEWGLDELMDKLPAKEESIIVGIDHGGEYRVTEYDPYNTKYGQGRGDDYVDFLVQTLKPYIDEHYRTKKNTRNTTIAGSSMGGLISMYAILKYPNVFGNAGVFSPAFWISPEIYKYAADHPLKKRSRIYFVCGDSEGETMVPDMQKMVSLVRSKGISEENSPEVVVKGAKHNEKQWNGDFPAFYEWLIRKSEVGGRKSEVGSPKSDIRSQR